VKLRQITTARELTALVNEIGFIPLFKGGVEGFSVEELTPGGVWYEGGDGDPWSWREELAAEGIVAYAKLFRGRAGFVSMEMYPHLANFRREGYDFDARLDEGLVRDAERRLYELVAGGTYLASDLRKAFAGKGFETALTALQMRTYITITGFERRKDRHGMPYGWSICCYSTSERAYGAERCTGAYDMEPRESFEMLEKRLHEVAPGADAWNLLRI
jgi:hypothetical protein